MKGKAMLDQLKSIDKSHLGKKMGTLSFKEMQEIDTIIKFVLGVQ
jgi:mRNA-degrading endonuclease toxin of MazEF toxin-antitoxin module